MNPHTLKLLFPGASASTLAANAADFGNGKPVAVAKTPSAPAVVPMVKEATQRKAGGLSKPRGRKGMNGTEAAFALLLEAEKQARQVVRYEREGITLRWSDGMTYTPDFAVWYPNVPDELGFIETKGPHIREDALVKFRAARAHWPEFEFQMWQRKSKKEPFTQIL